MSVRVYTSRGRTLEYVGRLNSFQYRRGWNLTNVQVRCTERSGVLNWTLSAQVCQQSAARGPESQGSQGADLLDHRVFRSTCQTLSKATLSPTWQRKTSESPIRLAAKDCTFRWSELSPVEGPSEDCQARTNQGDTPAMTQRTEQSASCERLYDGRYEKKVEGA